jgi:hypothetical protein
MPPPASAPAGNGRRTERNPARRALRWCDRDGAPRRARNSAAQTPITTSTRGGSSVLVWTDRGQDSNCARLFQWNAGRISAVSKS